VQGSPGSGNAGDPDAGIPTAYRSLLDERLVQPWTPRPPTDVSVDPEDGYALVTWMPPTSDGGSPVAAYVVAASGGLRMTVTADEFLDKGYVVVRGLENGKPETFTVTCSNALGSSDPSLPSSPVTPGRKRHFKAPTAPVVSVSPSSAGPVLTAAPPATDGGSPVIAFAVTSSEGEARVMIEGLEVVHADPSHPVVRGLPSQPAGALSAVSVRAVNAAGEGPASAAKVP
jgi:hypothetical protein